VSHSVGVRLDAAGNERFPEPEDGLDARHGAVRGDRVGGEEDARRLRVHKPLDDHRHADGAVAGTGARAVRDGALGEERGPTAADVPQNRGCADDVQVGVVLAGERCPGQVLGRCAGPDRPGGGLTARGNEPRDRLTQPRGELRGFDLLADGCTECAQRVPVIRVAAGQFVDPLAE